MTTLCHIDDIGEGQARGFYIPEGAYFAVKKNAQLFVYRNLCPHQGTPLEWQEDQFLDYDGELIQCASHGALFVIESGECVYGPCAGMSLVAISYELQDGHVILLHSKQNHSH